MQTRQKTQKHIFIEEAKEFYSEQKQYSGIERRTLETLALREYNNWVKSVIIQKYTRRLKEEYKEQMGDEEAELKLIALDLGCGKGGDLLKWKEAGVACYIGVDISKDQLKRAHERKKFSFPTDFVSYFIEGSFGEPSEHYLNYFNKRVQAKGLVLPIDIASCQLAFHYCWESEENIRNFMKTATGNMVNGGYLLLTVPDALRLVKKIRDPELHKKDQISGNYVVQNKYFGIMFDRLDFPKESPFKLGYGFFLADGAVGNKIETEEEVVFQYVKEYLVIEQELSRIAGDFGMEIQESVNFHEFYERSDNCEMLKRLKRGWTCDPELWDVIGLYKVIVYKKKTGPIPDEAKKKIEGNPDSFVFLKTH